MPNGIIEKRLVRHMPLNLDNYRLDDKAMSEREDDMKQLKERVQIGITDNGKPIYKWATGYHRQEVLLNAARILSEYGRIEPYEPHKEGPLFNDYMRDWYESIRAKQAPDRIDEEKGRLKNYIFPFFEGMRLEEIKPRDIDRYFLQDEIQALSTSTVDKHGQFLNMMFRFAIRNEDVDKNPVADYQQLLPKRVKNRDALEQADVADIISHLSELRDEDNLLLSLLLFTGMRRGEALGLQVKHIDTLQRTVSIRQSLRYLSGKTLLKPPKTMSSIRTIPILNGFPYELISDRKPDDFVLGGASPWTERRFVCSWQRIEKTINLHGATPHIFRHTYTTFAIASGEDLKTVQGLMGHATASITMDVYAHIQQNKMLKASERLKDMYSHPL